MSNRSDEKDTWETTLVLVLFIFLVVGVCDAPATTDMRERGSEGGEMIQGGSESRERVLVEPLRLTFNCSDENKTFETPIVPVLVLIPIVVLISILGGVLRLSGTAI